MRFSRRAFCTSLAVAAWSVRRGALADDLPAQRRGYSVDELDAMLRRRGRPENLFKADLPTPALLVDLDVLERNVARMAEHAAARQKLLRPHAKTHKCVEVARRQRAAGAVGVCVATVAEAVVMAAGGIEGILLTSPIASPWKAARMAELARRVPNLLVAVGQPQQIELYDEAAQAAGTQIDVLVDLDVGDRRTGTQPGEAAVALAQAAERSRHLRLRGLQAYSGGSSHVVGFTARQAHSQQAMTPAAQTRELFQRHGLPAEILSGGSTGTHNIDSESAAITELQVGSYLFMDVDYLRIGGAAGPVFDDFGPSLTVLTTVVNTNHPRRATVDAGFKAFATDRPFGPQIREPAGLKYAFAGDEFGTLTYEQPSRPIRLGDRLECLVPHCDPTVNLYDRIYACRGEQVEEIWSVMDRLPEA